MKKLKFKRASLYLELMDSSDDFTALVEEISKRYSGEFDRDDVEVSRTQGRREGALGCAKEIRIEMDRMKNLRSQAGAEVAARICEQVGKGDQKGE